MSSPLRLKLIKGSLHGYSTHDSVRSRRKLLVDLIKSEKESYRDIIGRLNVLRVFNKNRNPELYKTVSQDMIYLQKKFRPNSPNKIQSTPKLAKRSAIKKSARASTKRSAKRSAKRKSARASIKRSAKRKSARASIKRSVKKSTKRSIKRSAKRSTKRSVKRKSTKRLVKRSMKRSAKKSTKRSVKRSMKRSAKRKSARASTKRSVKRSMKRSAKRSMKRSAKRSMKRSVVKSYKMPRHWDEKTCKKTTCKSMGFSMRASCKPYKDCYKKSTKK